MSKKLYYTVEKQTQTIDTVEETTGYKAISVYEIVFDEPKLWFDIEVLNEASSEDEINEWLDVNGFGDRNYELVIL